MLGSIFRANLDVLLKQSNGDASWDKDNQKLDSFLANADVMESLDFPLVWTTEPTSADKQCLICKGCHQFLAVDDGKEIYMHGIILDLSSARDRWHPDCVPCLRCNKSTSGLGRRDVENLEWFKCEQKSCGFISKFRFIPGYYHIVCGMWLSWRMVI